MIYPFMRKEDNVRLIKLIARTRKKDMEKVKKMLSNASYVNDQYIAISRSGDELHGFMFATVEKFDEEFTAYIQYCYSTKRNDVQIMLDNLMDWAKTRGISSMTFMTDRNAQGFERKYKFAEVYKVLKREI